MLDLVYNLLSLCASVECDQSRLLKITQAASNLKTWETVPTRAEEQGLAPLLMAHLGSAGVDIPITARLELQGLTFRSRLEDQARTQSLRNILAAFQSESIQVLVLKGAALCRLLYPQPYLRPMNDLDLLIDKPEIERARGILGELGFFSTPTQAQFADHRHIPPSVLDVNGFNVSVELHHSLVEQGPSFVPLEFANLFRKSLPFSLDPDGSEAMTLGFEDMLYHLCSHLVDNNNGWGPMRLIWAADIVGFANRFEKDIDWEQLRSSYPLVINTLSLLHFLTPLPEVLLDKLLSIPAHVPQGLGEDYQGWPNVSLGNGRHRGYARILHDTFFPFEWWLRLRYGLGSSNPVMKSYMQHAIHILSLALRH